MRSCCVRRGLLRFPGEQRERLHDAISRALERFGGGSKVSYEANFTSHSSPRNEALGRTDWARPWSGWATVPSPEAFQAGPQGAAGSRAPRR